MEEVRENWIKSGSGNDKALRFDRSRTQLPLYARLSPRDAAFLEELQKAPVVGALTVEAERERMRCGQKGQAADLRLSRELLNTRLCPVHILRPIDLEGLVPITVYFHGGGWVLGELATYSRLVEELAIRSGTAVAFVEYPLAPENDFPIPLEACLNAVTELLDAAACYRLDATRFVFAGDSAGANLAASLQIKVLDTGLPMPSSTVLLYPVLDASQSTESYGKFAGNPNLSRATMNWFWEQYVSSKSFRLDPLASPLYAPQDVIARFPPTLCITCEYDVLRDEGEEFTARLIGAGVDVTAVRWLGALHGFLTTDVLSQSTSADECLNLVASFLKRNFASSRD